MNGLDEVLRLSTDIANCTFGNLETKRRVRAAVLDVAVIAIYAQEKDSETLRELQSAIKYSR